MAKGRVERGKGHEMSWQACLGGSRCMLGQRCHRTSHHRPCLDLRVMLLLHRDLSLMHCTMRIIFTVLHVH
jgi:hypothetical protein